MHGVRSVLMDWVIPLKEKILTLEGSRYILQTTNGISYGNDGGRSMICDDQQLTAPAFF